MAQVDLIIRNGRVIDCANCVDTICDIAVKDSTVNRIGKELDIASRSEFDATGCLVTPGLIDFHVHGYLHCTPLGVDVDACCLARGVTTVVDAGSSGASTFPGLRHFIAEKSATRVLAFLHIAQHGLAAAGCAKPGCGGECDVLNLLDVDACVDCVNKNGDIIVGVKIRLAESIADEGRNEQEAFRRALEASAKASVPLMVHMASSSIQGHSGDGLSCPGDLRQGDIFTHCYHGYRSGIIDPETFKIYDHVRESRSRGVLYDLGHGQGAFNWTVAERAAKEEFWPDIISTDLHSGNIHGPAYDLPTTMTKFIHLGMPINDVIGKVTSKPASAINRRDIGTLNVGSCADITVMKLVSCDVKLEDCAGQLREVKQRVIPVAVWRNGERYPVSSPDPWPTPRQLDPDHAQSAQLISDVTFDA